MDERQTDVLDDLHKKAVDDALKAYDTFKPREHITATDEPTAYGSLANEMLSTTVNFGDHESIRDCLATLADRLENLEVVVYGGVQPDSASAQSVSRLEKIGLLAIAVNIAKQELDNTVIPSCINAILDRTSENIGLDQTSECRRYDRTDNDCQPCTLHRRLHLNVHQTDDALALAISNMADDKKNSHSDNLSDPKVSPTS